MTPEELAEHAVVGLDGLALDVFQILCEPEAQCAEHAAQSVRGVADGDKGLGPVEIAPVLEVGSGLE